MNFDAIDDRLTWLACAVIIGLAWIVTTCINRLCRHEWEKDGGERKWNIIRDMGRTSTDFRQNLVCKRCGKMTWVSRG